MKYLSLLLISLLTTGCATSQWAMRNATDSDVRIIEKIKDINSVSLTKKHLLININTKHTSSRYDKDDNKKLCFDRIAFTPNKKETVIPIHSSTFICPQNMKSQIQE